MSNLSNPKNSLGVFEIPKSKKIDYSKLIIGLDNISDPGNLGTIIRLCDWFGVEDLICSFETVDCYNPKVVQASMGSISRINITYLDLQKTIKNNSIKTYGTYMQGDSLYEVDEIQQGLILFGNEANGINPNLSKFIDKRLSIPRFGKLKKTESLNVANALSIVLSENARKSIEK
jgi:TrmH family RNA methyltransferase